MSMMRSCVVLLCGFVSCVWGAPWTSIGPRNIYRVKDGMGSAGTFKDAVSLPSAPDIIYAGGSNNAASSGVLKTVNGGRNWFHASNGLLDTRVWGLYLNANNPKHLYVGTNSGIFSSWDAANLWIHASETKFYGTCMNFILAYVQGKQYIFGACERGIAYIPYSTTQGQTWNIIAGPSNTNMYHLSMHYSRTADSSIPATAYTTIISWTNPPPRVYRIVITLSGNGLTGTFQATPMTSNTVAVNPTNPNHVLATHPEVAGESGLAYHVFESLDGGQSSVQKFIPPWNAGAWYVFFDPIDSTGRNVWIAGQGLIGHISQWGSSSIVGSNGLIQESAMEWLGWNFQSADGYSGRGGFDNQWLVFGFSKYNVATCSDQGLYGWIGGTEVVSLNGDVSNVITTSVAPMMDPTTLQTNVFTVSWDRGPTLSYDDGATWPSTEWYSAYWWNGPGNAGAPHNFFEGGETHAIGNGGPHGIAHNFDHMEGGFIRIFYTDNAGRTWGIHNLPSGWTIPLSTKFSVGFDYVMNVITKQPTGVCYMIIQNTANGQNALYRSLDYGHTWNVWNIALPISPAYITCDPNTQDRIWIGNARCVYYSLDSTGNAWSSCISPSGVTNIIDVILNPINSNYIMLLQNRAAPYISRDGGRTYQAVTDGTVVSATRQAYQNFAEYSPSGTTLVLASPSNGIFPGRYIFRSYDYGLTWTDETAGLITVQINNIAWYNQHLYVATSGQGVVKYANFDAIPFGWVYYPNADSFGGSNAGNNMGPGTATLSTAISYAMSNRFPGFVYCSQNDAYFRAQDATSLYNNRVSSNACGLWIYQGPNSPPTTPVPTIPPTPTPSPAPVGWVSYDKSDSFPGGAGQAMSVSAAQARVISQGIGGFVYCSGATAYFRTANAMTLYNNKVTDNFCVLWIYWPAPTTTRVPTTRPPTTIPPTTIPTTFVWQPFVGYDSDPGNNAPRDGLTSNDISTAQSYAVSRGYPGIVYCFGTPYFRTKDAKTLLSIKKENSGCTLYLYAASGTLNAVSTLDDDVVIPSSSSSSSSMPLTIGLIVGISVLVFVLSSIALLLYRRYQHKQHAITTNKIATTTTIPPPTSDELELIVNPVAHMEIPNVVA